MNILSWVRMADEVVAGQGAKKAKGTMELRENTMCFSGFNHRCPLVGHRASQRWGVRGDLYTNLLRIGY